MTHAEPRAEEHISWPIGKTTVDGTLLKRASGPDAAQNMRVLAGTISMESHLEELAGAVRRLADDNLARRERICALGNSEGTLHILNNQLSGPAIPLAGLILTEPPGRSVA